MNIKKGVLLQMPPRTFNAQLFMVPYGESDYFRLAGTLDGFIDLATPQSGTYPLSIAEARLLIAALSKAITDVEENCLYENDALLWRTKQ